MKEKVIAVFDIGKTNKKLLLFDTQLNIIQETEERFFASTDDDGFECDNIELIEKWVKKSLGEIVQSDKYDLMAVNFATYGATLVFLDSHGKRLTPVYNYLKPVDELIPDELYRKYGGKEEFCRKTASPALGMLNSGIQILWLKRTKPEIFSKVRHILHFPQYFSYLLSGQIVTEHTSIGCHTSLWDFDNMTYHQWVHDENLKLPEPVSVFKLKETNISGKKVMVGTGLHDSSASLAPYFSPGTGNFILVSTGTWCISMNPFNHEPLTTEELNQDCLCYLSINKEPVKSSRLFLGHMHDEAVGKISEYFKINENSFRLVKPDVKLLNRMMGKFADEKIFTVPGIKPGILRDEPELFLFDNFIEAYHQLMIELADLTVEAINRAAGEKDNTENIFITGGFSKNPLFLKLVASSFPDKKVYTSEISNATSLGTAMVTLRALMPDKEFKPDLGLTEVTI